MGLNVESNNKQSQGTLEIKAISQSQKGRQLILVCDLDSLVPSVWASGLGVPGLSEVSGSWPLSDPPFFLSD